MLRAALVLTKADLVGDACLADFQPSLDALLRLVREIDPDAQYLRISARPDDRTAPSGLNSLLDWICMEDRRDPAHEPVLERPIRALGRFR